jgi:hypothetical protein
MMQVSRSKDTTMRRFTLITPLLATGCFLFAANASAQTLDPVFANSFESGLIGFGPPLSVVAAGASNTATAYTPLQVTLSAPAVSPTFVAITSSDPSHITIGGGGTTVNTGQTSAVVLVNGLIASATPVTLWATLGNTLGASVRVELALNETDVGAEADFCNVQFPTTINVAAGLAAPTVFGRLYEMFVTESAGPPSGWTAQLGYGPQASDPRLLTGWQYLDATYNMQVGNNDEFQANFTAPTNPGIYAYAYRFSNDGGGSWSYCDTDGAGSNAGETFSAAALGQMTVTDPYAGLVINEVDYDQVGTDSAEFIEIYNSGSQAIDLSTLALVLVNGNNNLEYSRLSLVSAGSVIAPGQYLVVTSSAAIVPPAGTLTMTFAGTLDQVQNGAPDGLALVDTATHRLLDALSYEGSITAAVITGFPGTYNLVEGTALSASTADSNTIPGSLARLPNGTDTNNASSDWGFSNNPTPGAANMP